MGPSLHGAVAPVWHEWFSRGLRPGTHYLEVPAAPLSAICPALLKQMLAMDDSSFKMNPKAQRSSKGADQYPRSLPFLDGIVCSRVLSDCDAMIVNK